MKDLLAAGLLPKWLQRPDMSQSNGRSPELFPGLPAGAGSQGTESSSTAFSGHKLGAEREVKKP